jgi:DNA-binding NarL/FixJ family response regulator
MSPVRILVADDQGLVRQGIRSLLESMEDVAVVGEAADGPEALRLMAELRPDVALLDISMPGLNGLEVAARASKEHPQTRIMMLSIHAGEEYIHRAFRAGATGYLLKNADRSELERAVRAVSRGESWLSPAVSRKVLAAYSGDLTRTQDPFRVLTPRQREILQLVAEGHSTKEIAQRLELSAKTVESHRAQLMERLGIHDVPGLVRYAIRMGLVQAES